ncbi:MAG: hypothetical protein KC933_26385 [Myxococcales bacterium]|nr:hypothetical protein [Myxococcales bacterium]MCB9652112.1 hypothetical protein [Deltaproteobacteria bacterium]
MAKDDLSTFRISDMRRASVRASTKQGKAAAPAAEEPSVGFPAVEARLETSSADGVAEELRASYEQLEAMSEGRDVKTKAAAKKAMGAYERAADLFEYLFQTKDALQGR